MNKPVISLLTDFGVTEHYVAAMKGVILGICPDAQLVDVSHEVAPFAVIEAAWTLAQVWHYFPSGTVHLVVIDPGVGSVRRPIVAEAGGHFFVAPDNGVLSMVFAAEPPHEVREIVVAGPVSQTFHGRDVFAPAAAYLAAGVAHRNPGKLVNDYVSLDIPQRVTEGPGKVMKIDRFGNVVTNFDGNAGRLELRAGYRTISTLASSYAEAPAGEIFLIRGSSGTLEISINQGSAARALGVKAGDSLTLRIL